MPDLFLRDKGLVCLFSASSKAGRTWMAKWMAENPPDDGERAYHKGALVIERQQLRDIWDRAVADGLWVREILYPLKSQAARRLEIKPTPARPRLKLVPPSAE